MWMNNGMEPPSRNDFWIMGPIFKDLVGRKLEIMGKFAPGKRLMGKLGNDMMGELGNLWGICIDIIMNIHNIYLYTRSWKRLIFSHFGASSRDHSRVIECSISSPSWVAIEAGDVS